MSPVAVTASTALLLIIPACWTGDNIFDDQGMDCTDMGCEDQLKLSFQRRDGKPFVAGDYTISIAFGAQKPLTCQCTLSPDMALGHCTGDTQEIETDLVSGGREISATIYWAPTTITASLGFNGTPIGDQVVSPDYQIVTPNGPDCEPLCFQASIDVEVSNPNSPR